MRALPLVLLAALALAAGGCGDSSPTTATTGSQPVASAPDATAPPADATQPGTGPVTTPKTPSKTTTQQSGGTGDGGGAERTRVPANFTIKGGKLVPPGVSAPAGLPIDVTVVSKDGKAHTLLLEIPPKPRAVAVAAGGRATLTLKGLRAGTYGIALDDRVAGGLVIGRPPGP